MKLKFITSTLYLLVIISMATATILEKYQGSDAVANNIYGAWWFSCLWALLTAAAVLYFLRRRTKAYSSMALHLSFVLILSGALLTHLTAHRGILKLRMNETTDSYLVQDDDDGTKTERLPFSVTLKDFHVIYHEGTSAAADYNSTFEINDNGHATEGHVSMNHIHSYKNVRFYQNSYDTDGQGSVLAINYDPYGIPVTYTGYALLFISLIAMLLDPKGSYRRLLRNPLLQRGALALLAFFGISQNMAAVPVLPQTTAEKMGQLLMLHNNRICPVETYAIDFTKKLCGHASYEGYSAEQVMTGFLFWNEEWSRQPIVRIKGGELKSTLQLPDHMALASFFNQDMGGYIIGPYIREYYQGNHDGFHKQAADIDERIQMVMELTRGNSLRLFPYTQHSQTTWLAPGEKQPGTMDARRLQFVENIIPLLREYAVNGEFSQMDAVLDKMAKYQHDNGGASVPSAARQKAEHLYNKVELATILFPVCLVAGLLSILALLRNHTLIPTLVQALVFVSLSVYIGLRWTASGTIPMSNGYESMLIIAWMIMLVTLVLGRQFRILTSFGFLLSGFFLLVSHISQMDPNITNIMPVLNSPLLGIHVSIIMTSFALLSLTFICGLLSLLIWTMYHFGCRQTPDRTAHRLATLQALSQVFLYPALATLGIGIFVGAIWANVSWGQYWGWDPKEVWALITFMVYAIAVHNISLPAFRRPMVYHTFMTIAFLTILMTYFGVNYFLGGMHSYA